MKKLKIALILSSALAVQAFAQATWNTEEYKLKKLAVKLTLGEMHKGDQGMLLSSGHELCTDRRGKIHASPEIKVTNVIAERIYATKVSKNSFNLDISSKKAKPEHLVSWLSQNKADQACTQDMLSKFTYKINLVGGKSDINHLITAK